MRHAARLILRALEACGRLVVWRCGGPGWGFAPPWRKPLAQPAATPSTPSADSGGDEAVAPSTFPIEAYNAALDRLVEIAREAGAREERARMAAIARLPGADRFPQLALSLALAEVFTLEKVQAALAAAESDARAWPQATQSPATVLH